MMKSPRKTGQTSGQEISKYDLDSTGNSSKNQPIKSLPHNKGNDKQNEQVDTEWKEITDSYISDRAMGRLYENL